VYAYVIHNVPGEISRAVNDIDYVTTGKFITSLMISNIVDMNGALLFVNSKDIGIKNVETTKIPLRISKTSSVSSDTNTYKLYKTSSARYMYLLNYIAENNINIESSALSGKYGYFVFDSSINDKVINDNTIFSLTCEKITYDNIPSLCRNMFREAVSHVRFNQIVIIGESSENGSKTLFRT
jgi:hypothetical protein